MEMETKSRASKAELWLGAKEARRLELTDPRKKMENMFQS
jgi:hypothetical protein